MSVEIPESHIDLLEKDVYVVLSSVKPDGQPHSSVVWANTDGEHVLINTKKDSQKAKNLAHESRASVMAIDPTNPYRWLEIRGEATVTEDGAIDHIDQLAKLYKGEDKYFGGVAPAELEAKQIRVKVIIKPTKVTTLG